MPDASRHPRPPASNGLSTEKCMRGEKRSQVTLGPALPKPSRQSGSGTRPPVAGGLAAQRDVVERIRVPGCRRISRGRCPAVPISENARPCLAEVGKSISITVLTAPWQKVPAAFERPCTPAGGAALSTMPDMLRRRALPAGRLAALGATRGFATGRQGAPASERRRSRAKPRPIAAPAQPAQGAHSAPRREWRGAMGPPQTDAGGLGRSPIWRMLRTARLGVSGAGQWVPANGRRGLGAQPHPIN